MSQVCYVLAHSLVKFGNGFLSLPVLLMARFGVSALVLSGIQILFQLRQCFLGSGAPTKPIQRNIPLLVTRAVLGLLSMSCYFYALRIGPLGRGNLIFSLSVLWAYCFVILLRQERPTWRSVLGIGTACVGLCMLFTIRGHGGTVKADVFALMGSFFAASVMVSIKALRRAHSSRMVVNWFYGLGAVLLLPFFSFSGLTFSWSLLFLIAGIGVAGLLAQWLMTEAYKSVPGSVASSMNLLGTPLMMVVGVLFFSESFHHVEMLGALFIMMGLVSVVWPRLEDVES